MDLNLDTLKREILEYLGSSGFAVFRSHPGGLESLPMVTWDTERYPDYQMFLETARKIGCKMILFAARDFDESEIEDALEQLDDCEVPAELRVDLERRVRAMRGYEGVTCSIELPTAMEFVLEALHQNSILAKERTDTSALAYTDMFSTMLGKPEDAED